MIKNSGNMILRRGTLLLLFLLFIYPIQISAQGLTKEAAEKMAKLDYSASSV
jgi:hypothetical protein